jgi:uncharacterized protein (TIGR02147 family)
MTDVFNYYDYREFLKDYFEDQKKNHPFFSYRYVAHKVGVDASNIVKIIQGKRNLSHSGVKKFTEFLKFNSRQAEYFEILIRFNRAKSDKDIKLLFERLLSIKDITPKYVEENKYKFYQKWYYTAVAALLYYYDFKDDYKALAEQLDPPISVKQAKDTINLLEELDFIKKNEDGRYVHNNTIISTGKEWHSIAIQNFQEETLKLAFDALTNIPKKLRDISTLTITVTSEDLEKIKEITREYRKAVLKVVNESEHPECVYQLNMQLFPLTKFRGRIGA